MIQYSLAYRIAKKLLDGGFLFHKDIPDDYKIVRTRAGRHQLAAGAFSWELVHKKYWACRYGCYERASDLVNKNIMISGDSFTGEAIIHESP